MNVEVGVWVVTGGWVKGIFSFAWSWNGSTSYQVEMSLRTWNS